MKKVKLILRERKWLLVKGEEIETYRFAATASTKEVIKMLEKMGAVEEGLKFHLIRDAETTLKEVQQSEQDWLNLMEVTGHE